MPASGKHRRPRTSPLARRVAVVSTGGVALALPLMAANVAQAAGPTENTSKVSGLDAKAVSALKAAKSAEKAEKAEQADKYSVVKGDTLSLIAQEHEVDGGWKQLYKNNREAVGGNPDLIHPGLELSFTEAPAADRSTEGTAPQSSDDTASTGDSGEYADNLDGWIREAMDIMAEHGIPGSYDGIHRNIIRESGGDPQAINNWDSNAAKGTPSKGLLQTIDPTFDAYHVEGTSTDPFDPVANIVAACNYAADMYGSMDNVNGPY